MVPLGHCIPTMSESASSHSDGNSIRSDGDFLLNYFSSHLEKKICSRFAEVGVGDDLIDAPLETHRRTTLAPNVDGASFLQRGISDSHIRCPTFAPVMIPFPEGVTQRKAIAVCYLVRHPKNREQ